MKRKMLVIDDDKVTCKIIERILLQEGFMVSCAHDGQEGYDLARSEKPDLIISDMLIPHLDGLNLCRKIREDPEISRTKIILMSAVYRGGILRGEIDESGADDFVVKPIDKEDLVHRIYKLLLETFDE